MHQTIKKIIGLTLVFYANILFAQPVLTLSDAIFMALENNYDIKIAKQQAQIHDANNTLGNAGFLPSVSLNLGQNFNLTNTKQIFFSDSVRQGNNINTNNLNANLLLAWTLFDGNQMFVNRQRLKDMQEVGQLQVQMQMENTIALVMAAYYNIDQQVRRIETIKKAIQISIERYTLATLNKKMGLSSAQPVLQAEVDINADSSNLVRQEMVLQNFKIQLNELLGRAPQVDFDIEKVQDDITIDYFDLEQKAEKRNLSLAMAEKNIQLSELAVKNWKSNRYPSLDLNLGYNFNRLQTELGILKFNQNNGIGFGLTSRWNIFDGFNNQREIQVSKLQVEANKLTKEQTLLSLQSDMFSWYKVYESAKALALLEQKNMLSASQNVEIAIEKMKQGVANALEVRQAQLNLIDAEFRKITAIFEARLAALEMLRLSGALIKS